MSKLTDVMQSILSANGELDDSTAEFLAAVAASNSHPALNGGAALLRIALGGGPGTINATEGRRE